MGRHPRRALAAGPQLVMSHLACADEPDHPPTPSSLPPSVP